MKKQFLTLIGCILCSISAFAQSKDSLTIGADYQKSVDLPMLLQRGKTYTIQSDSVFAINARRWEYYAKLEALKRHNNIGNVDEAFMNMVQHYQNIVDSCEYYFKLLDNNTKTTQDKSAIFLENTKKTIDISLNNLNNAQVRLDTATSSLTRAETHLTTAIQEIKKAKRIHLWQKIGIGAASFAIGTIVGLFIK